MNPVPVSAGGLAVPSIAGKPLAEAAKAPTKWPRGFTAVGESGFYRTLPKEGYQSVAWKGVLTFEMVGWIGLVKCPADNDKNPAGFYESVIQKVYTGGWCKVWMFGAGPADQHGVHPDLRDYAKVSNIHFSNRPGDCKGMVEALQNGQKRDKKPFVSQPEVMTEDEMVEEDDGEGDSSGEEGDKKVEDGDSSGDEGRSSSEEAPPVKKQKKKRVREESEESEGGGYREGVEPSDEEEEAPPVKKQAKKGKKMGGRD